jgi:hypothetical protein
MLGGSRLRAAVAVLAATTASLALAGTVGASSGGVVIDAQDVCDPATFNPAGIGCQRVDGSGKKVTLDELFARVQKDGAHGAWRFASDDVKVKAGQPVDVRLGRGGEFHTFTKVARFGPGCVPELNEPIFGSPAPGPECFPLVDTPGGPAPSPFVFDGIPTDGSTVRLPASKLSRGTNLFECMIHPWMKAKVTVE